MSLQFWHVQRIVGGCGHVMGVVVYFPGYRIFFSRSGSQVVERNVNSETCLHFRCKGHIFL